MPLSETQEMEKQAMANFAQTLERFLESEDFKEGVLHSTRASWSGSGCTVEIFPTDTWRILFNNNIGNRYETPGVLLHIPTLDGTEEELEEAFYAEEEELKQEMRESL